MANFDPYHQWLGIPPSEQPPDHYRLLGIRQTEDDPAVIENAADRQMAHLKTFQAGPRSADSQRLLNEVATARVCLLNPHKKETYDQQLSQASADDAAEPEITLDTTSPPIRKSRGNSFLMATGLGVVTLVVIVTAAIFLTAGENEPPLPKHDNSIAVTKPTTTNPTESAESAGPSQPLDIFKLPPGAVYTDNPEKTDAGAESSDDTENDSKSDPDEKRPAVREDLSKMTNDWGDEDFDEGKSAKDETDPDPFKSHIPTVESPDNETDDSTSPNSAMAAKADHDSEEPEADAPEPTQPKQKLPLPSPARQKEIVKRMEGAYDFSAAQTASAQRALAWKLYRDGLASRDSEGESFVLLSRSAELSAMSLDADGMFRAIDAISARYQIDHSESTPKLIKRFVAAAKTPANMLALQQACRKQIDEHLAADRYQQALDTAKATYQAVSKSKNKDLRKQTLSWQQALTKLQKDHQAFLLAQRKLAETPENANAALTVGCWYCFGRDDYAKGLPLLANGSNSLLAAAAKSELQKTSNRQTPSPDEQAALGDAWWKLAEKTKGCDAVDYRLRAIHWYALAKPNLSGLSKASANKRLDEFAQLAYQPRSTKNLDGVLAKLGASKGGSARIKKRHPIKWMAYVRCDDSFEMRVNGKPIFRGTGWGTLHQSTLDMALGDIITVRLGNRGGPRGFCCVLRSEKGHVIISGPAWQTYEPRNSDEWSDPKQISNLAPPLPGNVRKDKKIFNATKVNAQQIWGRNDTSYLMLEVK